MIITIDGCVATGKSTVAKKLAESIGFIFFDTGAMYRALTYGILKEKINIHHPTQLETFLTAFPHKFEIKIVHKERRYFYDKEEVTEKIRGKEVTASVSEISAIKPVRDVLIHLQRELAIGVNAVFEGRDMGTVAFPDAALKVFLTGRDDIRAKRRYEELKAKYPKETETLTFEECMDEINKRDAYDMSRVNSPLVKAADSVIIDTSDLTIDEVVFRILEYKDSLKTKGSLQNGGR